MRILILAPWPYRHPRNGGQLRAASITRAYEDAGHEVRSAGLYIPSGCRADDVGPTDIALSGGAAEFHGALPSDRRRSEMSWWEAVAAAPESFAAFAEIVREYRPDLLQFEEIALWPVVRRLKRERYLEGVTIVHSSYNFETIAWGHRSVAAGDVTPETLRDIAQIEQDIASEVDLIVAVSDGDAREFVKLNAAKVCVAPNGVACVQSSTIESVSSYLPASSPYALFVSSAHPPNARGIVDFAAGASGHPLRHGEIMVCGKVGGLMEAAPQFRKATKILGRCRFLGWVDDVALNALYRNARVVILPKMYSGGSNLKTAEAIVSGRPIVATKLAFEGFEPWIGLNGVAIADDPDEFWRLVDSYLMNEHVEQPRLRETVEGLLWKNCLEPMIRAAEAARAHGTRIRPLDGSMRADTSAVEEHL
ncbi:glycosyltransferase family 4 protein [Variovorax paradoxus]|nr:glycosyltransferase family 4 protein [Variovorax paradoxus]